MNASESDNAPTIAEHADAGRGTVAERAESHPFVLFWRAAWGRAYVRIVGVNREWSWMFFELILPVISLATFVFIYKGAGAPPEFAGFAVLGGAMTAFWMNVLWAMASQFYWEKRMGNLGLYMMAPASRMAILFGMAIGGSVSTILRFLITIVLGMYVFNVGFDVLSWPKLVLAFLLTVVALYMMGMMFASLFIMYGRGSWHMIELMIDPVYLVTGLYFPLSTLGPILGAVASLIPMALGLDAMRQLAYRRGFMAGFLPVNLELLILAALGIAFFLLAKRSLAIMEVWARAEGTIGARWQ